MVRAHASEWRIDPNKIGIMGFSAGAELSAPAAIQFEEFDKNNNDPSDPLAGISSRPDFVGIVYPGPSPFTRNPNSTNPPPTIPLNCPPSFLTCAGSGDKQHAVWADDYFAAMLAASVPNLEMHIYGNGAHAGGLTDRSNKPFGTWQLRFIDWFRDLGFLQKSGVETRAAQDIAAYMKNPPRRGGGGFGGGQGRSNRPNAPANGATPPVTPAPEPAK